MANESKEPHFIDDLFGGRRADTVSIVVFALICGVLGGLTVELVDSLWVKVLIVAAILLAGATAHVCLGRRRRRPKPSSGPPSIETIP